MNQLQARELDGLKALHPELQLVDVRTPQEYRAGNIEGFINIPLDDLMRGTAIQSIKKNAPIVVMCHSGSRSLIASRIIESAGNTNVYNLVGGYMAF